MTRDELLAIEERYKEVWPTAEKLLALTDILRGIPPAERRDVLYAVERLLEAEDRMPNILTRIREGK